MKGKVWFVLVGLVVMLLWVNRCEAFIIINELLADPAPGLAGDANNDGIGSTTQDEFVELFNDSNTAVDLSGWSIRDALQQRHVFPVLTILSPQDYIVVFAGGAPNLPGINWQIASTGTLSLNNSNETVSLFDSHALLMNQIFYGAIGGHDQSIVRWPEGEGAFVLHTSVPEAQGKLFSPGTSVDGQRPTSAAVPEPATIVSMMLGGLALIRRKL